MTARHFASESGSVSVWLVIIVPTLILVAGLVSDGGKVMTANERAQNIAEEAARAGADSLSDTALRNGVVGQLDPVQAQAAAQDYLHSAGVTGTITVTDDTVTVTTTITQHLPVLSAVGVDDSTVTGHARARSIGGITKELP
ncbi:MAG: hypothetical protein GEU83_19660 [Pseudonocardiaceae bacterium]|nr:hypothetical protein [Pseudonocardiaceae bacterium]